MQNSVNDLYGNRLRVRACGICIEGGRILMINHRYRGEEDFWSPPGGGIHFGETAEECVVREFREETGLHVKVGRFLCACEFLKNPLHAIELFFEVSVQSGIPTKGFDPEMSERDQIIQALKFLSFDEIGGLKPTCKHGLFQLAATANDILALSGYFKL